MKKRIISIALSLCTVLSLFPVSAHAEEASTPYYNAGASVSGNNTQSVTSQGSRVENVQAMLNSLPTVTELEGADEATINAAYEAAQNVYDAIEELEAEEIALLTNMEKLTALMEWFNGRVMTLNNTKNVSTEEELKMSINSGMKIILDGDITLTNSLIISSDYPETIIQTNGYTLKGTIKLIKGTLIVEGVLDADIVTDSDNSQILKGGTYKGNVSLNERSQIDSGTYDGQITGTGTIKNGTFNGTVNCNSISNGIFNKAVTCDKILYGVFTDSCTVKDLIFRGVFYKTPSYAYKNNISTGAGDHSYYIIYIDGDSTYATEYMLYIEYSRIFSRNAPTPSNPTKENCTFEGWYKNSNFTGEAFDINSLSTSDFGENGNLILYAKWKHNDNAHVDDNLDHKCDVCYTKLSSCNGGTATCKNQAVCTYCGKPYGEVNENNHALKHHQANAATIKATGNKEYWECTDCGKLFMDEKGTNATERKDIIIKKLIGMLEGMGQSITAGENKELTFRSSAEIGDFRHVELDGNTVDSRNYTVREGSTIITLNAEYVASLPAGEHTISIVSTTGTASASFTILEESSSGESASTPSNEPVVTEAAKKTSPATGDDNNIALWITLLILGGLCIGAGVCGKKSNSKLP